MQAASHQQGMRALHAQRGPGKDCIRTTFRAQKPRCVRVSSAAAAVEVKDVGSESVRGTVRKQNEDRFAVQVIVVHA